MSKGVLCIPSKIIATCVALVGFACAIVVGTLAGNDFQAILLRAIFVLIVCWFVGKAIGALAQRTMEKQITMYKQRFPIPKDQEKVTEDDQDIVVANALSPEAAGSMLQDAGSATAQTPDSMMGHQDQEATTQTGATQPHVQAPAAAPV